VGIRIHKAIGYSAKHPDNDALYNSVWEKCTENEVADLLQQKNIDYIDTPNCAIYQKNSENPLKYPKYFHEIIHSCSGDDSVFLPDPIVIIPPSHMKDWYRWDDGIDYIEETLTGESSPDRLVELSRHLYPYTDIPKSVQLIADHLGFNSVLKPVFASWWS